MPFLTTLLSISTVLLAAFLSSAAASATFKVTNNCPYPVWAADSTSGGRRLNTSQTWTFYVTPDDKFGRIWARTNCLFDSAGNGQCETGDCGGVLDCKTSGQPPVTLAEYLISPDSSVDYFDISVVDGFNVPMEFSSVFPGCTRATRCTGNIISECPRELRVSGGCKGACGTFDGGVCGPTNYTRFFKERCPNAYSYPTDEENTTFTCPSGTNYRVVFCPPEPVLCLPYDATYIFN